MTYAVHHEEILRSCNHNPAAARTAVAHRGGIWRRIFNAVYESRRRHADREVAAFIERSGGRMTDNIEFQISQRLMTGDWNGWR
jgi:hypothetical protein